MRAVEDPGLAVVELAEQQHQPSAEEGDVGRGEDQLAGTVADAVAEVLEKLLGVPQVLDDVQEEQLVELVHREGQRFVEVGGERRDARVVDDRRVKVGRGHGRGAVGDGRREHARAGAEIENPAAGAGCA